MEHEEEYDGDLTEEVTRPPEEDEYEPLAVEAKPPGPLTAHFEKQEKAERGFEDADVVIAMHLRGYIDLLNSGQSGYTWQEVIDQTRACQRAMEAENPNGSLKLLMLSRVSVAARTPFERTLLGWRDLELWARDNNPAAIRQRQTQEAEAAKLAAEREARQVVEDAERAAAGERARAEHEQRGADELAAEVAYIAKLPEPGDYAKLGQRWVRLVVNGRRAANANQVSAICKRPYPPTARQDALGRHLDGQLWDLVELGNSWDADKRSLGWLHEHFTKAGGRERVFWSVLADVVSGLDDSDDDPGEDTHNGPQDDDSRRELLERLNAEKSALSAALGLLREGRKFADQRSWSEAAADICEVPANTIRATVLKKLSKDGKAAKIDGYWQEVTV